MLYLYTRCWLRGLVSSLIPEPHNLWLEFGVVKMRTAQRIVNCGYGRVHFIFEDSTWICSMILSYFQSLTIHCTSLYIYTLYFQFESFYHLSFFFNLSLFIVRKSRWYFYVKKFLSHVKFIQFKYDPFFWHHQIDLARNVETIEWNGVDFNSMAFEI